ncbi:Hpt domain-containing protein [Alteromonas sp.]|uniref:Hpt domain-containing protein n=1 Tax=Alteromonas sp. TaxID=232 RepID=UPI000B675FFE|nr:Hpt domain-containing protein [Alteromonas sp.]MAI37293.1 histidine kinase [Alteromonas sp.]OUX88962.1 MAG: histidine kinase [Alteromonas sp. TMED35]|tara:strand:+ start:16992 stop:17582 length:591 start_codon:yes stop_codon:yes gene_type:complete
MDKSTTLVDLEFGMSQLSGNKKLLFTLLGKFTDEYRLLDANLQALMEKEQYDDAYSLMHTLKGVTGNLGLFALHNDSKQIESAIRNEQQLPGNYPQFVVLLNDTVAEVDSLTAEPAASEAQTNATNNVTNNVTNSAAAERAEKQLVAALKASEFISQTTLDEWLNAMNLSDEKREAIIEAVDELDYEEALATLDVK